MISTGCAIFSLFPGFLVYMFSLLFTAPPLLVIDRARATPFGAALGATIMRLFSWFGLGTVLIALASGYAAGVAHRPRDCPSCYPPPMPCREEEATPPPPPPGFAQLGPRIAPPETIDLTIPPSVLMAVEPPTPIVDPEIHQVKFEFPSGGDKPPYMPYIDD
jgi:hypothetical protein